MKGSLALFLPWGVHPLGALQDPGGLEWELASMHRFQGIHNEEYRVPGRFPPRVGLELDENMHCYRGAHDKAT